MKNSNLKGFFMKKVIFAAGMALTLTSMAQVIPADKPIIDALSHELVKDQLLLVTSGNGQPFQSDDGAHVFNFDKTADCDDRSCHGLLFAYSAREQNVCIEPTPPSFGDLPVKLNDGTVGRFTVPSIADPDSTGRDYLFFYKAGTCYEMDFGNNGQQFSRAIQLANMIVGG